MSGSDVAVLLILIVLVAFAADSATRAQDKRLERLEGNVHRLCAERGGESSIGPVEIGPGRKLRGRTTPRVTSCLP